MSSNTITSQQAIVPKIFEWVDNGASYEIYVDGAKKITKAKTTSTYKLPSGITAVLFARRYGSSSVTTNKTATDYVRIHSFYLKNNTTGAEIDLVPMISDKLGLFMLDRLTGRRLYPKDGSLIAGPKKSVE